MVTLKFFGYSCFLLKNDSVALLVDPYLTNNASAPAFREDIACTHMLLTYAYSQALNDAVAIAKRCDATVISCDKVTDLVEEQGCKTLSIHIGVRHLFDFGWVRTIDVAQPNACGFIVQMDSHTVYFAGHTACANKMHLLKRSIQVDYGILPIGGDFELNGNNIPIAKYIVPMHWPLNERDVDGGQASFEKQTNTRLIHMNPGDEIVLAKK